MADAPTFIDAIKTGDFDRVKAMLSSEPVLIESRDRSGASAILTAVYHRQRDIVNLLVSRGVSLTLFEAAAAGELERAERLLDEQPATVNSLSADGWTPLHLAAFFGHTKVAELLLDRGADVARVSANTNGNTPLHAALAGNHKMVAGLLMGAGADVNAHDATGWCPLHIAASNNNLDAMKTLIAQGADVSATNSEGQTPLSIAQEQNQREAAALLRRHGG